jgi:cytochrome c-type biogenesis protein CcmF
MAVIGLCQTFMISMIVGVHLGPLAIGASPVTLLSEAFPDAAFLAAGGVPPDGTGLNDLLKNYWMVIHPPTLFVGFAAMVVPFAYAMGGLWLKQYTQWVKPALPWALFATMMLFLGISMGGYWAYVTLSFGGYWAWDPVENSSLVPFLVGAAAIHTMIAQRKSGTSQKASILLTLLAYLLVIYSTFLTRSGILGDISVHSFVDLGLYNQLLIWIATLAVGGVGLFLYRYRELPTPEHEPHVLSREFMIFLGALTLCALALVIILGTSAPIFGRIFRDSPAGVPIEFYNRWSLPISVLMAMLVGLGQLFWWTRMSIESLNRLVVKPLLLAIICTALVLMLTPFSAGTLETAVLPGSAEIGLTAGFGSFFTGHGTGLMLLLLVFSAFFAFFGNGMVFWRLARGNMKLAGGAITHLGLALMLFGIITSSSFSDPIAPRNAATGQSRENFVVNRGQTVPVNKYVVTYRDSKPTPEGHTQYILDVEDPSGRVFVMRPVAYKSNNDQWIQHPDIKSYMEKDIYMAVFPQAMSDPNAESDDHVHIDLQRGQSATLGSGEYELYFDHFTLDVDPSVLPDSVEVAVAAHLRLERGSDGEERSITPIFAFLTDRSQRYLPVHIPEWNVVVSFVGMNVDNETIRVAIEGVGATPQDWIVVQAFEKPFINLLWIGILMMLGGFGLSIYRRATDQKTPGPATRGGRG